MGDVGFKQWIDFEYNLRGKAVKFDVTNNPKTLQNEDWRCVVAVFVEGRVG
jgi:predicted chitinase